MQQSSGYMFNNITENVSSKLSTENKHNFSPTESQQWNKTTEDKTEHKNMIYYNKL